MLKRVREVPVPDQEAFSTIHCTVDMQAVEGWFVSSDQYRLYKADFLGLELLVAAWSASSSSLLGMAIRTP